MPPSRRKKWTEAEERTLIDKYGEMVCDGTLAKMKTREKKYKPISLYVNSVHHVRDPIAFPWQWSWKDVSIKVHNMRHQYCLVKQKVKKKQSDDSAGAGGGGEEFDWVEGLNHWSNFVRYKEVFGDVALLEYNDNDGGFDNENDNDNENDQMDIVQFENLGQSGDGDFVSLDQFDYDGEENYDDGQLKECDGGFVYQDIEAMGSDSTRRKKRKAVKGLEKKRVWGFFSNQLEQLREMENRFQQREVEREQQRQKREKLRMEHKEKEREALKRRRIWEWEAMEKESEEREKRRREEQVMHAREWEERMNKTRSEWKMRIDERLSQHRAEMGQIQSRLLDEQQNLTNQLLAIVSQYPTGGGLADHQATASNHYISQMMHHDDSRVEEDNQFIVDG